MKCQICKTEKLTGDNRNAIIVNDLDLMQEKKRLMDSKDPKAQLMTVEQILLVCNNCKAKTQGLKHGDAIPAGGIGGLEITKHED